MHIIIPSSGRPKRQTTLEFLAKTTLDVRVAVPVNEGETYRASAIYPVYITEVPVKGIGHTRQCIVENHGPKVIMLDDDLTFYVRRKDAPDKFADVEPSHLIKMIHDIDRLLDTHAHVGVSTREGGNRVFSEHTSNGRMLRILAYRTDVLRKEGIRFDRLPVMEDFDVTLSLLRRGYASVSLNWIVHNQNGSNLAGGCSQYRSPAIQRKAALELQMLHPEFVKVVTKKTKVAWGGQERTDVRIQWKKAYESAAAPKVLD